MEINIQCFSLSFRRRFGIEEENEVMERTSEY